jgi:hypothetical protein
VLNVHPFVAAYLTKGFPSLRSKWFFEHKKWVKIIPRDAYTYLEYHFLIKKEMKLKNKKRTSAFFWWAFFFWLYFYELKEFTLSY